jgi:hypothetical protein
MKKVIFAAVVLFSMTTFAVNPKNINPVKEKTEIEKLEIEKLLIHTDEIKVAIAWVIKCGNGWSANITTSTFSEAANEASDFCGNSGWQITGNN